MKSKDRKVKGYDFDQEFNFDKFINSFATTGFQATNLYEAINICKLMNTKRQEPIPDDIIRSVYTPKNNCTIFLGYTSNMVSCGNRDIIKYLVEHNKIDVIVTTCGGIEEDLVKCFADTIISSFDVDDVKLRENKINRIGNLSISSTNYELFEDWLYPILDEMIEEQQKGFKWTPSSFINLLGKKINHPDSIYYWAYKNNIPIFCPAITDGSIGDIIYFHAIKKPGLMIDIVSDLTKLNNLAKFSLNTGMIILGAGLVKHHICNANLMRNGADYSVFINTNTEFDGSDSGASPSEAVSWGKIKSSAIYTKVFCDATIAFPLIVASVFKN